jgi:hypothetical protein
MSASLSIVHKYGAEPAKMLWMFVDVVYFIDWRNLRVAMRTPKIAPHDGKDPTAAALAALYDNYDAQSAQATSQTWLENFEAKEFRKKAYETAELSQQTCKVFPVRPSAKFHHAL